MTGIQVESLHSSTDIIALLENKGYTFNMDGLVTGLQAIVQSLMDVEVSRILDATRYERSHTRRAYRNGYRHTVWATPIGEVDLRIPKLRRGTYYPDQLLNDGKLIDALIELVKIAVLYEADYDRIIHHLDNLTFIELTTYEKYQIVDALRTALAQDNALSDGVEVNALMLPGSDESIYLLLTTRRNGDNQLEIFRAEQTYRLDRSFWRDFSRRMAQSGVHIEDHQSVLSGINPYAVIRIDKPTLIFQPDAIRHFQPQYKLQLIA